MKFAKALCHTETNLLATILRYATQNFVIMPYYFIIRLQHRGLSQIARTRERRKLFYWANLNILEADLLVVEVHVDVLF